MLLIKSRLALRVQSMQGGSGLGEAAREAGRDAKHKQIIAGLCHGDIEGDGDE